MTRYRRLKHFSTLLAITVCLLCGAGTILLMHYGPYRLLTVQTDSMQPALRHGDIVLQTRNFGPLAPGDVVTYPSPINRTVSITHRVVAVDPVRGLVQTKGDHVMTADAALPVNGITGKVLYGFPNIGHAVDFARKPLGLLVLLYIPALMIVNEELTRLKYYYGRRSARRYAAYRGYR